MASSKQHVDALNDTIQHAHLDATTAVPIGGGEHARVGDIVVTRRNDRQLVTDRRETVHNQHYWQVTDTRADGAMTVTHTDGRGTVTLPAGFVAEHVRLGYAATEYGHQGDTVEVGVVLTFPTTTHHGLYVATTRGRDENRIHVVTQHDDPAEARDILDGVLVQDRADHPAITQRRQLATAEPERGRRSGIPASLRSWRDQLADRRQQLLDADTQRKQWRTAARGVLRELQPALDAARRAWEPYDRPMRDLEHQLETELRPAMRQANHHAGHRRHTQRHAADATRAVERAQAAIATIRADGAPVGGTATN